MKKVIANSLFKVNDSYTGVNVTSSIKNLDLYLKNSFVSLYSAKVNNPDADVILILNYDISREEQTLFLKHGIQIVKLNEYIFKFPGHFKWAPAFFKLDALNYLYKKYDLVCVLDSDTIFVDQCNFMWEEAQDALLVLDIDYSLESPKRQLTNNIAKQYFKSNKYVNHWGGEIIVGTSQNIKALIERCKEIYNLLIRNVTTIDEGFGQEALLSIALEKSDIRIERANKYCMRYWTRRYYLVDTNYSNIPIWHLPAEKDCGLINVFNIIIKNKKLPHKSVLAKNLNLKKKMGFYSSFIYYSKRLLLKIKSGKKINLTKETGWIDK